MAEASSSSTTTSPRCSTRSTTATAASSSSIPVATWPQDAPHPAEEHILSVLCGPKLFRWAVHQLDDCNNSFYPILYWRTAPIEPHEFNNNNVLADEEFLSRYLPTQALDLIYGGGAAGGVKKNPKERTVKQALAHRSLCRIPALSIYVALLTPPPDEQKEDEEGDNATSNIAERGLQFMFQHIPHRMFQLQPQDLLDVQSLFPTPHAFSEAKRRTVEDVATIKAAHELLYSSSQRRRRPACLIVSGGSSSILTSTEEAEEDAKCAATPTANEAAATSNELGIQENTPTPPPPPEAAVVEVEKGKTERQPPPPPPPPVHNALYSFLYGSSETRIEHPSQEVTNAKTDTALAGQQQQQQQQQAQSSGTGTEATSASDANADNTTATGDATATAQTNEPAKIVTTPELAADSSKKEKTTTTTKSVPRIVAECHSASVNQKLQNLYDDKTAKLPEIDATLVRSVVMDGSALNMTNLDTNTGDNKAKLVSVLQEMVLFLRSTVEQWAFSDLVPKTAAAATAKPTPCTLVDMSDSSNTIAVEDVNSLAVLCITGAEADIWMKLLDGLALETSNDEKNVSYTWFTKEAEKKSGDENNDSTEQLEDDAIFLRLQQQGQVNNSIGNNFNTQDGVILEVIMDGHLPFHGIRQFLAEQRMARRLISLTEVFHERIIGCRVVKDFGGVVYRGHVISVDRKKQLGELDVYRVRYDDGDSEDYLPHELHELLVSYGELSEERVTPEREKLIMRKREESRLAARLLSETSVELKQQKQGRKSSIKSSSKPSNEKPRKRKSFVSASGSPTKKRVQRNVAASTTSPQSQALKNFNSAIDIEKASELVKSILSVKDDKIRESLIFDTCAEVRIKIRDFLKIPGVTKASFCRALGTINPGSLAHFLGCKGDQGGCGNITYRRAWVFFEKKRIHDHKGKSSERIQNEAKYPQGFELKNLYPSGRAGRGPRR